MTDILKKIEALLIEEGIISDDKPAEPTKAKNIIDINFAVTRGHKMEFSDNTDFKSSYISLLIPQNDDDSYFDEEATTWKYCRYLQDEWLINPNMIDRGSEQILPDGLLIEALWRDGRVVTVNSHNANFSFSSVSSCLITDTADIIAYRILGPAEGWKYEWESE